MTLSNIDTVRAVFAGYEQKDRAAIEALMAADLRFTSPYDNGIDRETYFRLCWPNSASIERFELVNMAQTGDVVFVTYEAHYQDGRAGRNTEVFRLSDGKVVAVEIYFGWNLPHPVAAGSHKLS